MTQAMVHFAAVFMFWKTLFHKDNRERIRREIRLCFFQGFFDFHHDCTFDAFAE